jgi:murein DD-endopeptidase MepM/ murein hydrolase activator NlpD
MLRLRDFINPTPSNHGETWNAGHFYSGRSPSTSIYDPKTNGRPHLGFDQGAPRRSKIVAPADGIVQFVGDTHSGAGNVVQIRHLVYIDWWAVYLYRVPKRHQRKVIPIYSRHLHLDGPPWPVRTGDAVKQGDYIGPVGTTGASMADHNHTELILESPGYQPPYKRLHIDPELVYFETSPCYYYGGLTMEAIKDIQKALNDNGYKAGPVDGIWGPRTGAAFAAMVADAKEGGS